MNIQQLQYIIALDRYKNFTKASQACFITQATMSTMIRRLEEELKVVIFDRKANPIITTDIGKEIIAEAEKALVHIKRMTEVAKEDVYEGPVRIGIIPTVANSLLPKVLKPWMEEFPNLEFIISESTTEHLISQLKEDQLDFGIVSTPIQAKGFYTEVLYYEPLKVYGRISTNKKYLASSDLQNETNWLLEDGHCIKDQIMSYCSLQNKDNQLSNLRFQSHSFETLLNMVDSFGGLTILPDLYIQNLPEEFQSRIMEFEKPYPVREVSLIAYRTEVKSNLGKELAEKIRETVNLDIPLKDALVLQAK
ncbi:LysR substrate-binding domain-containing protein [Leadbetterella byssophila]|uniref:Transcriptional regulator, LysR family n=1 Tax=Leadbetterella byssophila (strain DSM 17132 / JCM 16389 / KACC 11308 / NBRC 106382 / 4M15) TaxID=649349 RepID=E4RRE1_LEAB4|nr:LysR substrate-binding domain-containing protein [Leadbetterella byssophila]ADQ18474.1 transcriptional regulator, LysR family [Leadbetterella byssophila DSM 17132]